MVFAIDLHEVGTVKNVHSQNEDTMFSVKTELRGVRDALRETDDQWLGSGKFSAKWNSFMIIFFTILLSGKPAH